MSMLRVKSYGILRGRDQGSDLPLFDKSDFNASDVKRTQ